MPNKLSIMINEVKNMTYEQEVQLIELTRQDEFYQQLLAECDARTPDYLRILRSLSEADQELLDTYISVCENLEYRRTCLAASMSKYI